MNNSKFYLLLLLSVICIPGVASGDDFDWTGLGGNTSWSTPDNWTNLTTGGVNGFPDGNDNVLFSIDAVTTNGSGADFEVQTEAILTLGIGNVSVFGSIVQNNGHINFLGSTSGTDEFLTIVGDTMLAGDGELVLAEPTDSRILDGGAGSLINVGNTIRGRGSVEVAVANEALIRAENGRLRFTRPVDNTAGNIEIQDGATLTGDTSAPIFGGTVTGIPGSLIEGGFSDVTFEGTTGITFAQTVFSNTITNNGTIAFDGSSSGTDEFLTIVGDTRFEGDGELILVEQSDSRILDGQSGLLRNISNTIRGRGRVEVAVVNAGTIFADFPGTLNFLSNVQLAPLSSVLAVRVDGFGFSQSSLLNFNSTITLGGELEIFGGIGFDANVGDARMIISSPGVSGEFENDDNLTAVSLSNGFVFDVIYDATSVSIEVVDKFLLGDVNQDEALNLLDVQPFVELLVSGNFQLEGDVNGDGVVDLLDVGPFVNLLTGG